MNDLIKRQAAIDAISGEPPELHYSSWYIDTIKAIPSEYKQPEIIKCKNCIYWKQIQDDYGNLLEFGFCNNYKIWKMLYGDISNIYHISTEDNFYCGYAKEKTNKE